MRDTTARSESLPAVAPCDVDTFSAGRGYLAACTGGLPTRATVDAIRADTARWERGIVDPAVYGALAEDGRATFAAIVGTVPDRVAIGSQTSGFMSVVACSIPDGAEVLLVDGDFSSVVFPFLAQAHRGVRVRSVPLAALAASVTPETAVVAWSAVQSATGALADDGAVRSAAAGVGALTVCDLTQAAGVLPVDATRYDVTVTHAYKWLCCPRGVAFMTVSDRALDELRPVQAGWYAGADVWSSCYGPTMALAADARRFDVSPAWQAWAGAVPALRFFAALDMASVWRHAIGLADRLSVRLGLVPQGQAIVTWADPSGRDLALLQDAGLTVSGRAGRVRVAFHLWNDESDVDAVVAALGR
ncbi:aminotransferase class V-fold PLP-dependent enzyme [Curtobacterium sp. RRHDQ10]|uniref:aminotransferase class V-fold PLP-dependent enzyme n=1 Tax=Curtobacterium phyllosphaerae TaxID=3413379 RepID=UPI003BEFBE5C